MKRFAAGLVGGLLFGAGLCVSGMNQPERVQGFLDFFGAWDPSLLLVMVGAIGVHLPLYHLLRRRQQPLLEPQFHVPRPGRVDGRLVAGATLFGVGWGLGGFCPGPAITAALTGTAGFAAMASIIAGVVVFEVFFAGARVTTKLEIQTRIHGVEGAT